MGKLNKEQLNTIVEFVKKYGEYYHSEFDVTFNDEKFMFDLRNIFEIMIKENVDLSDLVYSYRSKFEEAGVNSLKLAAILEGYPDVEEEIRENGNQKDVKYEFNPIGKSTNEVFKETYKLLRRYYSYKNIKQEDFDAKIIDIINYCPEILTKTYNNENFGMICAKFKFENIVLRCLDDKIASTQQLKGGENLGMYAVIFRLKKAILKSLKNDAASKQRESRRDRTISLLLAAYASKDDSELLMKILDMPEICLQQDVFRRNIGMYAAIKELEEVVLKALDNPVLATQQDGEGKNIGMYAAEKGLKNATIKAMRNQTARNQRDIYGRNIEDFIGIKDNEEYEKLLRNMLVNDKEEYEKLLRNDEEYEM